MKVRRTLIVWISVTLHQWWFHGESSCVEPVGARVLLYAKHIYMIFTLDPHLLSHTCSSSRNPLVLENWKKQIGAAF